MSHILWSYSLTPPEGQSLSDYSSEFYPAHAPLKDCLPLMATDRDIEIPDPRALRHRHREG